MKKKNHYLFILLLFSFLVLNPFSVENVQILPQKYNTTKANSSLFLSKMKLKNELTNSSQPLVKDTTTIADKRFFKSSSTLTADYDGDGILDNVDLDRDNDGIPDEDECPNVTYGAELILNGDFENGYAHWTSDFNRGRNNNAGTNGGCGTQGWVALSPCASKNGSCATYYNYNGSTPTGSTLITSNLGVGANVITTTNCNSTAGNCWAQSLPDHTTGNGLSMYIDPSDIPGESYWIQTINIQANTFYEFSAWIMVIEEDPNLVFKINNTNLTNVFNLDRQTPGSDGTDVWQPVLTTWFSGSNSGNVIIELTNVTAGCAGNDIRLDDVSFRKVNNLCDCDGDGIANINDLDSDNDGISDLDEAGHNAPDSNNDGIIDGSNSAFGTNGLFNNVETSSNSGVLNYTIKDSESVPDGTYDFCEIDADGDGCLDTQEASISDNDKDGVAGNGTPTITTKGLVSGLSYSNPSNNNWQNPSVQAAVCVEICNNGIDDDGDGLVDIFDDDCPCANTGYFFGNCDPTCEYIPPSGSANFDLTTQWEGTVGVTNISQLFVGDMDNDPDGVAEIITMKAMNYHASDVNAIYILDGADGTLKYHPNTLRIHNRNKGVAIGDADDDGRIEFYYMTADDETTGNSRKIACYEYNPGGINPAGSGTGTFSLQWVSNTQVTCGLSGAELFAVEDFTVGLADFNYDGTPEVYVGNEIYNAITGARIATGGTNSIGSWNQGEFASSFHVMAVTVAIDVLPDNACTNCSGLELVAGNQVYAVNIAGGTMSVEQQAPSGLPDGNTAIVDYDLDGDLDAVVTTNDASKSFLYIWDLQTNTQISSTHTVQTTSSLFYHPINLPIIADFDGDNKPEIGVCGNFVFQVVEDYQTNISGTGGVLWSITTSDNSGQTGAAVFDFNGDGVAEVVYRDESNLRLMSGPTGANLATFTCMSGTGGEYAVIADIDNDEETEIICNCANAAGSSTTAFTKAFKSNQFPWVPTRKLWNQYAYFNVNINDDLSIPIQQQLQHFVGSPANGVTGKLNVFLKQISPLDTDADFIFPAPDLTTVTTVDASDCITNQTVDLSIAITNNGDLVAPAGMPITIYRSDPEGSSASIMTTITTTSAIDEGNSLTVNHTLNISSLTFPTTIYLVVNDDGSMTRPYSLSAGFPNTSIGECNFSNNKESITLNQGCTDEVCNDGQDNDGDGFIDCADSDCAPILSNVAVTQPNCTNKTGGQIVITASSSSALEYSITNEPNYQSSNIFQNLGQGLYTVRVKSTAGCVSTYTAAIIQLESPNCPEICNDGIDNDGDGDVDCDDSDCGSGNVNSINNNE